MSINLVGRTALISRLYGVQARHKAGISRQLRASRQDAAVDFSCTSMAVPLADDKLPQLRDRLKNKPTFLKVYYEVVTKIDGIIKGFDFLVDKWPDFTAVVAKPNPQMEFEFLSNIYSVGGEDTTSVVQLLEAPGVVDWKKDTVFACIESSLSSAINETISHHCGKANPSETCFVQAATVESLKHMSIPEGFKMSPLTPEDSDLVNNMWKFTLGDVSHAYVKTLISSLPSCCLYDQDGAVIGFAMSYHYGALGLLHVMEEHRGKGYGKVIMSYLANECLSRGKDAFVIIEESNEVSLKLHEGLGFNKLPDTMVSWIRYTPKGCCAGPKACCI